jgi:LPXTG-site transpeptidase (sortase) family protein
MADPSNMLDLGSLRDGRPEPPKRPEDESDDTSPKKPAHPSIRERILSASLHRGAKPLEPANHPEAAAQARKQIAGLESAHPLEKPNAVPAVPTATLVTSKQILANRQDMAPTVVRRKLPNAVIPLVTALGVFLLVLILFKAPVIISQLTYRPPDNPVVNTAGTTSVIPAESTISIPKINVHAPIKYVSSVQEADVQRALQDGVVHYGTTAKPGQVGNTAIFGHSSNDWWEPGNYKFVFVLLDKLVAGDKITLDYQGIRYTYEVSGSRVVEPTAVEVLNATPTPTLTLITCTPPGTALKRLVVTAKQVSPAPTGGQTATAPTASPAPNTATALPSSPASFLDPVVEAWNNVVNGWRGIFDGNKPTASPSPSAAPGQLPAR